MTWLWILGGIIAVILALAAFALSYPWQSDPWGLNRWL